MASFDNLMTMEPWAFRSAFGDSWYSDVFARETDALTKVLQKSMSTPVATPLAAAAAEGFPAEMVFSVAMPETTPVQTPSASGGSENETPGSKRRNVGPSGKITKRKSRAAKRATTTYITADAANFRQMVQQVTGVRFAAGGGGGKLPVPPILKPEPHRAINQLPPHTSACLPTLDTSAFLLDHNNQKQQMLGSSPVSLIQPTTLTSPPPPPSGTVADGGVTGFDFDAFSSFPTLESWN
ncbi:PREDICTED: calmodulin-binding protein 25 [Ipomoea nil]|uniref:calmodulin-binding protein 25 n=1 Tax=Ipomoea nil TaxID=35883 RepID=UPI000900C981|nr:PREDICTED: calmodulin-binding protein 25 [Ipomoea nil]